MVHKAHFLGIDINAYGLAFSLIDREGQNAGMLRRSFGERSGPGEHDSQDWWRAVRTGVKELLRRTKVKAAWIRAIGLTGLQAGSVLLDDEGKILFPALIGSSDKLLPYVDQLQSTVGGRNLANLTGVGNVLNPGSMAPKLLAVREIAPRVWHDLHQVLLPRDYLRYRMTDVLMTDPSSAAKTYLYSSRAGTWSKQVLERLEFDPNWFQATSWGNRISGRVTENAARETSLIAGTPVVTGGSHQASAAIAVGATEPGDIVIELGSNGSLFVVLDKPQRDLKGVLNLTTHCIEGRWAYERQPCTDGHGITWLMEQLLPNDVQQARRARKDPLDHLCEMAAETSPGSDGLLFLPPLNRFGSSTLHGLSYKHGKGHLLRAVLESTALRAATLLQELPRLEVPDGRVFITGPGAESRLWSQIVSDAIGRPVTCVKPQHLCARGAAVLASSATGQFKNLDEAIDNATIEAVHLEPRSAAQQIYNDLLPQLDSLHTALANQGENGEMP